MDTCRRGQGCGQEYLESIEMCSSSCSELIDDNIISHALTIISHALTGG